MTGSQRSVEARPYVSRNPATGEVLKVWAPLSDVDANEAVELAHAAYLEWRRVPVDARIQVFDRIADLIDGRSRELARQVTTEMGKHVEHALAEVGRASSIFRYYARNAKDLLEDEPVKIPNFVDSTIRSEPIGVVLGIEPWNGPLYQAVRVAAPNLMLGNTVLLKPAEITAGSTMMLDEIFLEAGLPANAYRTALLSVAQIPSLIADPRIRAVTLTGSDRAGAAVAAEAGKWVKPVVLELGGSDPFVVLDSADPIEAAHIAATARMWVGGQVCVSPKRVIVTEGVADDFIAEYAAQFRAQSVGDPFDPATTVGPLSSPEAVDLLEEQMQDAIKLGATVLVEGGRVPGPGSYFSPAVITDVTPEMRLYAEEAFGPLGIVYRVSDTDAAIALANDSVYGLGATVMGETNEAEAVAGLLDTGSVGINAWLGAPIESPFGGTKASGFGRELGRTGMSQFANQKVYGRSGVSGRKD
jgi:succinate-semialdehyde dehydrogenase/glutarate-semialdehyde dehydrogenase